MSACSCCTGIHKQTPWKEILFTLLVILNVADLVVDWLLYVSVSSLQTGLVYGPIASNLKTSLLIFTIVGSVLFPLEIGNAVLRIFRDKCLINVDVLSAFVLWLTDVPQIIVNVIIASCREELVSDFQIVKASVVISGCAIRLSFIMVRYCSKKRLKELQDKSSKTRCRVAARFLVVLGVIITCIGSILVFIFSQFHVINGVLLPYNSQRYFDNVGIFLDPNVIYSEGNLTKTGLIKVGIIQNVILKDNQFTVRYSLESVAPSPRLAVAQQVGSKSFQTNQCFRLNLSPELNVSGELPANYCDNITTTNSDVTIVRFEYKKPVPSFFISRHIFGEIYFNVNRSFTNASLHLTHVGRRGQLGYFRYEPTVPGQQDLMFPQTSLDDVRDLWRTGYFKCESSGSLAPVWDPTLTMT